MKTTEELWAALERSGASARYAKLLHGLTLPDLQPFFECAAPVVARPEMTAPIILDPNWRVSAIGAALAALAWSEKLAAPLIDALGRGSFVAPQLAGAIASIPRPESELPRLRALLDHGDAKTALSAYAALSLVNDPAASAFDKTPRFAELWAKDDVRCVALASKWRGIWSVAGPHFRQSIGWVDPVV